MKKTEKHAYVYQVFESVSEGYDRANERISLGLQRHWKRMLTDRLIDSLPAGSSMLDICCGTGDIAIAAAKGRPDVTVTGADFSPAMLEIAKKKGAGIPNLHWEQADAMQLPFTDQSFSAVTISFGLRNTPDYEQVTAQMSRVLKPGGYIYCLDSFVPDSALILPFYQLYFKYIMPLIGGGRKHLKEYRWLWLSTKRFLHKKELARMYRNCGLEKVGYKSRMFGACVMAWGRKPKN
jgi:demethylmenaquinone methyltransferase/2-methoxy-6-polyprenyl-1,4-benzoquinol methylase